VDGREPGPARRGGRPRQRRLRHPRPPARRAAEAFRDAFADPPSLVHVLLEAEA
jgi:hypothetical protein